MVRLGTKAVAAGMLVHGWKTTEIPSASSLRAYNSTNANSLMYWNLLERAIQRGQETFDFGRSTPGTSVCSFKEQWGAKPEPAEWQYYMRAGASDDMRPDNPRLRAHDQNLETATRLADAAGWTCDRSCESLIRRRRAISLSQGRAVHTGRICSRPTGPLWPHKSRRPISHVYLR